MLRSLPTKEQRIPLQHQLKPLSVAFVAAALGIATYSGMDVAMKGLALQVGAYNAMFWRSLILSFSLEVCTVGASQCGHHDRCLSYTSGAASLCRSWLFFSSGV